ncbi:MAG: universal stress protein [Candidatus Rokuibacteriota bacterium]
MPRPDRSPIVHATDFSREAVPAFRAAVSLAAAGRRRLSLVHVLMPPSPFVASGTPWASWEELEASARREARRHLGRLVLTARRHGVRAKGTVLDGPPAETIARAARAARAGLLVIGTHGRTGITRIAMGSVAGRVLRIATCPVLTVRARRRKR